MQYSLSNFQNIITIHAKKYCQGFFSISEYVEFNEIWNDCGTALKFLFNILEAYFPHFYSYINKLGD